MTHGLLEKQPYREPGKRTRDGYRLTEKGRVHGAVPPQDVEMRRR